MSAEEGKRFEFQLFVKGHTICPEWGESEIQIRFVVDSSDGTPVRTIEYKRPGSGVWEEPPYNDTGDLIVAVAEAAVLNWLGFTTEEGCDCDGDCGGCEKEPELN